MTVRSVAGVALPADLALRVVQWQRVAGRHDLPWQASRDPYRVWLSEIMLQQTQVSTVLAYFPRFVARFPDVQALAAAHLDEVLALWSGLGYYSRARNLHRCAQTICADWGGQFPSRAEQLQTLPGIGRSTAAAVAAFCFGEHVAIMDGNVRRVLGRALGYGRDLAVQAHERELWDCATALLPPPGAAADARWGSEPMASYTQGLMDLGATLCTRRNPDCAQCPLAQTCVARREGDPHRYPVKTRKLKRSSEAWWLLWARRADGAVWLVQRPTPGVWAGLYCLPVLDSHAALQACAQAWGAAPGRALPVLLHVLTHKDLHLHPVQLSVHQPAPATPTDVAGGAWFTPAQWPALGLPAPIRKLLMGD